MARISGLRTGAAALALCFVAASTTAQEVVAGPTPTADALAEQIRIVTASPRNVSALITAGELAAKLGDTAAALSFFSRAEAIEPRNPRISAGRAGLLVMMERPGEALRLFARAETAGVSMTPYLAQRGLAYDLVGQTGHAQRDYRRALLTQPDDETVRRLALSLGISGRRDEAMTLLDPLLRKSDRAAWRARACILAMGGDMPGAAKIAANMIPGGAGLGGFFARLQWLSPADRAFAVHFGDVTPSAARTADARLAPAVAVLPADSPPLPPIATASVASDPARQAPRRTGDRSPSQTGAPAPSSVAAASVVPTTRSARETARTRPVETARAPRTSQRSGTAASSGVPATSWLADGRSSAPIAPAATTPPVATVSSASPAPAATSAETPSSPASAEMIVIDAPRRGRTATSQRRAHAPTPAPARPAATAATTTPVQPSRADSTPPPAPGPTPVTSPAPRAVAAADPVPAAPASLPAVSAPAPSTTVASAPAASAAPTAVAPPAAAQRRRANTELLASIVSRISVPAAELEVRPIAAPPRPAARQAAEVVSRPADAARTSGSAAPSDEKVATKPAAEPRVVPAKKPDPKVAAAKAQADAKAAEAKKAEAAKIAEAKKKAEAAKADAPRWWVQVAGGARAADLDKDWKRLTTGSSALKGKAAYTTPLRATNRLLTGPFKTEAEARAVVNALAKEGKSAFTFQSAAGQKVDRLGSK